MSAENIIAIVRGAIHTGNRDFVALAAFVEREMRNLREETIEECAKVCDKLVLAYRQEFKGPTLPDTKGVHNGNCAFAAERIRSLKQHPPTQPDAQTEQPMHMQNGLTLEQREWIRAEIACALESRPAAPPSKADALLAEVVRVAGLYNGIYADAERWRGTDLYPLARALTAAREYVERNKAGDTASETQYASDGELGRTAREDVASKAGSVSSAPSSLEVEAQGKANADCVCGHPIEQHSALVFQRISNADGSLPHNWSCHAPEGCGCTQPQIVAPASARTSPTAPPPTTGEREVPSWVPSVHDLRCARDDKHYAFDIEAHAHANDAAEVEGLRRIRRLIADAFYDDARGTFMGLSFEEWRKTEDWIRKRCAQGNLPLYEQLDRILSRVPAQRSPLSPEAKGEGTVRDLVRKIDELRERALRERSNTALLDFRAATFDAWPTIRAALTGGAL